MGRPGGHGTRLPVKDGLNESRAEILAHRLQQATTQLGASVLVGAATATGKDVLPRASALLGQPMVSEVSAVTGPARFERPAYAGNAVQTVEVSAASFTVSVRQTAFKAVADAKPQTTPAPVVTLDLNDKAGALNDFGAQVTSRQTTTCRAPGPRRSRRRFRRWPWTEKRREFRTSRNAGGQATGGRGGQPGRL